MNWPLPEGFGRMGRRDKNEAKAEFARRLQDTLLDKGWNQSELGRKSGISRDNISGYIRGRSLPNPVNLKRLSDALNVDRDWLLPPGAMPQADAGMPQFEGRQLGPDRVFLRVNQEVTWQQFLRIAALLKSEDEEH